MNAQIVRLFLAISTMTLSPFLLAEMGKPLPKEYSYDGQNNPEFKGFLEASESKIQINRKYFQMCEAEVGVFPAETIECEGAVAIPTARTLRNETVVDVSTEHIQSIPRIDMESQVEIGEDGFVRDITTCDKPSGIFRDVKNFGCVPGNRVKHIRNTLTNGDTVDWVYICRKNNKYLSDPYLYNELGMIAYNRNSGKTCFFAGQPTLDFKVTGKWMVREKNKTKEIKTASIPIITGKKIPPPQLYQLRSEVGRSLVRSRWRMYGMPFPWTLYTLSV